MTELEPLLVAADIAALIRVTPRQVVERYAMRPDFPKAIRLPSMHGRGPYRWKRSEIMEWIDGLQQAA